MEPALAKQLGYDPDLLQQLQQQQQQLAAAAAEGAAAAAPAPPAPCSPPAQGQQQFLHLWHFYCAYWLDFGAWGLVTNFVGGGRELKGGHTGINGWL